MTTQANLQAAGFQDRAKQWTQVRLEAVMAHHQFIQLASGGQVLILERLGLAFFLRSQRTEGDLIIDRRQNVSGAGEKTRYRTESVAQVFGLGGLWQQRESFSRETVEP